MSTAGSIPDSQLGLTQSELMILRQSQEVAAQSRAGSAAMGDRGRGTSRHSQPSSRTASAASSHSIQGRITMDSTSLGRIENALNNMVRAIQVRIEQLEEVADQAAQNQSRGAANTIAGADREIERSKKILAKLDELDDEMEKVVNVCKKIKALRLRCEQAGGRMDQIAISRSSGGKPPTSSRR